MKKILLLGGSAQQVTVVKAAKRLGYYTVLCDYLPDNPGQYYADKFYLASTTEKDTVLGIALREQVEGVLAFASDPAAPTAAYVGEKLHLKTNPYQSVDILCNKDKFREFLKNNGFFVPLSKGYEKAEESIFEIKAGRFGFPIIIKPVDSSGSKGATVLYSEIGVREAIDFAFSFSRSHKIIVEEFIEKKHPYLVGGDIFVADGEIVLWGLLNCHRDSKVNPLVPVGKSYPLELNDKDVIKIKETLKKLVQRLRIKNGAMNVELIIDKKNQIYLIDVGPRSGGNMIPDMLSDMFGVDIAELSVRFAMGETLDIQVQTPQSCFATHNLHSDRNGIYKTTVFTDSIQQYIYRKHFYKKHGDSIEYFDNASKCLGIVFMKFDDVRQMKRILNRIEEHIQVVCE